jgi:peptidyl-prolyl cis-trans isomerase C
MRDGIEPRRASRLGVLAGVGAGLVLTLAACGREAAQSPGGANADAAVAVVDGQTIWASDVRREAVSQGVIGEGEALDPSSELFRRMLDEVLDQKLLAAEANRRGVASDPQVRLRLAAARDRILGDVLVQKMVEQAVNDQAIRGLYEEQRKLAKPAESFHARQIVTASQPEADAVRKLLAAGAAFEALATERSIDAATRFNGGDLGYFTLDVMPEAYGAALKTARAGDIVGPFKTDAGWAILRVEDRRPGQPMTLDEARPRIVRFLTYDQVRDLLQKLRAKARIQMLAAAPAQADPSGKPAQPARK